MTTKEKRNEIYNYIRKEVFTGKDQKWQDAVGKMLKDYAKIVLSEVPEVKAVAVIKKEEPKPKKVKITVLTGAQLKENDIKRGIWRPDSHYNL